MTTISIKELMTQGQVPFGTSGARGLVENLTDKLVYGLCLGFAKYMLKTGDILPGGALSLAGDLRPSSPRILNTCAQAIIDAGCTPDYQGLIPSPAIALWGLTHKRPSLMVTGSHIPADRNGIKFNKTAGEILKEDEQGLSAQIIELPDDLFDEKGGWKSVPPALPKPSGSAAQLYMQRYIDAFGTGFLTGLYLGFYEHSAVGRDLLPNLLEQLGAQVSRLDRSTSFVPVDTEAIRPEDVELAKNWAKEGNYFAFFSTDGDSDRPLIGDEKGQWLRGDSAGILTAQYLKADAVVAPVSCNSALEKCGSFTSCIRTKIGSPYVIEGLIQAETQGNTRVVGYEANGGFFIQTPLHLATEAADPLLAPLPTRDPVIVLLGILGLAKEKNCALSKLNESLPPRFGASGRLQDFPTQLSSQILEALLKDSLPNNLQAIHQKLGGTLALPVSYTTTDGLRVHLQNLDIIHLRPSGNAPEFRCYTESASPEQAVTLLQHTLKLMESWRA